jgi:hypothetical protein
MKTGLLLDRLLKRPITSALVLVLSLIVAIPAARAGATIKDIATDANDPSNLSDTEPSIAVNPANPLEIAVVSFSEGWGPGDMAPVWRSNDGGVTWTKAFQLPQPNPSSFAPGDQKIAFDASGNLYVAELAFGMTPPRLFVYRQTGAATAPLTVGTVYGSTNDDQPHLDVDHSNTSAFLNRLYSPWLDFSQANERSTVGRSTNSGATVTSVGAGDNGTFVNRTTRMAVAPDGKAYIIYKTREGSVDNDFENVHFHVNRSDDGGVTWAANGGTSGVSVHGASTVQSWFTQTDINGNLLHGFGNPSKGKVARARSSDAWIAADPGSGDVYAAYVSRDGSGFGQIFVARSANQGANWTSVRVTDGTHHSAYPEIAVAVNGAVGVLYIDYDDSGAATLFRHRFARSFDHGVNWTDEILQSMDPGPLANAASGFLWGDYEGLTADGQTFYGVFTGQSIGRATLQLDPIFFKESAQANHPPDCNCAVSNIPELWPPNHKFVSINILGVADPDGDPVAITINSIRQDEPLKGSGTGNTCPDATGLGTNTAHVRAERAGTGDGRVYHIGFTADDGKGGTCTAEVKVCVPHDQGKGKTCVDQGSLFDSTVCP